MRRVFSLRNSRADVRESIDERLDAVFEEHPELHNIYLLVHSDEQDVHWKFARGRTDDEPAHPDQPYFVASVGKMFTATLVHMLAEGGDLRLTDPIAEYLSEDVVDGLHVYEDTEYSSEIRIDHLLGHTSGLPHFYHDTTEDGRDFTDVALADPGRTWEPAETIEWMKDHLEPRFPPGEGRHYSDPGYNLLGLVIERVTGRPFHEALHEYLFTPLGMDGSFLPPYSEPAKPSDHPVAPAYVGDQRLDVTDHPSFGAFFACGQTVNTAEDLLAFHRALANHELVSDSSLAAMRQWSKLETGVDYGHGLMRVRPIPFVKKYYVWGHFGFVGAFSLYSPSTDAYLVGNFNQSTFERKSGRFAFGVLRTLATLQ